MREIFFTADHHFSHRAILKYTDRHRRFADINEMDEFLIKAWNARVRPGDEVYHVGDLSFARPDDTLKILRRLNGQIHLIRGNHDRVGGPMRGRLAWVKYYHELRVQSDSNGTRCCIILCHYAFATWNKAHHGSWHLHGHSHGTLRNTRSIRRMDVGVDTHPDYAPYSLGEVADYMKDKGHVAVDHHVADRDMLAP